VAAVYGPRPGTRKGENPEKASIEVVWKPFTGQSGQLPTTYLLQLWRSMAMLS
jgi:exosome complex component RRP46